MKNLTKAAKILIREYKETITKQAEIAKALKNGNIFKEGHAGGLIKSLNYEEGRSDFIRDMLVELGYNMTEVGHLLWPPIPKTKYIYGYGECEICDKNKDLPDDAEYAGSEEDSNWSVYQEPNGKMYCVIL